jgi:hypothetical protein
MHFPKRSRCALVTREVKTPLIYEPRWRYVHLFCTTDTFRGRILGFMPTPTLHLTTAEQATWQQLPPDVQRLATVQPETSTAYETPAELDMRAAMASFAHHPECERLLQALRAGDKPETLAWQDLPQQVWGELLFTIGATGVSALIRETLPHVRAEEEVTALVGLTVIRHQLLLTNASICLTPHA